MLFHPKCSNPLRTNINVRNINVRKVRLYLRGVLLVVLLRNSTCGAPREACTVTRATCVARAHGVSRTSHGVALRQTLCVAVFSRCLAIGNGRLGQLQSKSAGRTGVGSCTAPRAPAMSGADTENGSASRTQSSLSESQSKSKSDRSSPSSPAPRLLLPSVALWASSAGHMSVTASLPYAGCDNLNLNLNGGDSGSVADRLSVVDLGRVSVGSRTELCAPLSCTRANDAVCTNDGW